MKITIDKLPVDVAILHKMIVELSQENDTLTIQLTLLKAKRFGKSSEKLDKDIDEIERKIEENEATSKPAVEPENDDDDDKKNADEFDHKNVEPSPKNKAKRKPLPPHLPRENVTINPDPKCPDCGGENFRKIGDDISEILEYNPSSFKVIRRIRPRCACINCDKIVQAELPDQAIAKGKAGHGLLAHILVQKYCNHLPLYRQ